MSITIKDDAGIAAMRTACRLASEVLDHITPLIRPGITTQDIDRPVADRVEDLLKKLSPAERQRLLAANAQDLELYDYGNWLIERGSPA